MYIEELIHQDYIFVDYPAASRDDLLTSLGSALSAGGFVKDSFSGAIIRRENQYPTGLPTKPLGIAIPHTDIKHVNHSRIAIAKLKQPAFFKLMGDNHTDITVDMVFMLALNDAKAHLSILQKVIQLFSDKDVLTALKAANAPKEIYNTIVQAVNRA